MRLTQNKSMATDSFINGYVQNVYISASVDITWIVCFGKVDFSYHFSGKSSSLHSITVDLTFLFCLLLLSL